MDAPLPFPDFGAKPAAPAAAATAAAAPRATASGFQRPLSHPVVDDSDRALFAINDCSDSDLDGDDAMLMLMSLPPVPAFSAGASSRVQPPLLPALPTAAAARGAQPAPEETWAPFLSQSQPQQQQHQQQHRQQQQHRWRLGPVSPLQIPRPLSQSGRCDSGMRLPPVKPTATAFPAVSLSQPVVAPAAS